MTSTARKHQDLPSTFQNLSINTTTTQATHRSKPSRPAPIADSWDDSSSSSCSPTTPTTSHSTAPPPTPISAVSSPFRETWENPYALSHSASNTGSSRGGNKEQKRPEKSTATAGRLIAGALGVKAPRMGEEQKRYERVVREKERERVGREKEERTREERERERRSREVWDGEG